MSIAKLKHYKVRPDDLLDLIDAADAAQASAILKRCPGGRLIRDGYMCGICGKDPSARYDSKGNEVYGRTPGEKQFGRCGAPAKRVLAKDDLTRLYPTHIEG
jgi:hypothetical protein